MLHLNWDSRFNNGIITNARYNGALFVGEQHKPVLPVEYDSFEWDEGDPYNTNHIVLVHSIAGSSFAEKVAIPSDIEAAIRELAANWVQPSGQEGNPSQEQIKAAVDNEVAMALAHTDKYMMPDYPLSNRDEFIAFRQALREVNLQEGYPLNVQWPPLPEVRK